MTNTSNFQRFECIGRLGMDPEMRMTTDGRPVIIFSVCIESFDEAHEQEEPEKKLLWMNVSAEGLLANICESSLRKGYLVYLSGELLFDKFGNPRKIINDYKKSVARFDLHLKEMRLLKGTHGSDEENGSLQSSLIE